MTCLHFLLCDRLKFESRDSAANPVRLCHTRKCGAEWSQQPNCFPPCEHAASVGKRKQERSIRRQRNGSYFSFQSTAQSVEIQQRRADGVTSNRDLNFLSMWGHLWGSKQFIQIFSFTTHFSRFIYTVKGIWLSLLFKTTEITNAILKQFKEKY